MSLIRVVLFLPPCYSIFFQPKTMIASEEARVSWCSHSDRTRDRDERFLPLSLSVKLRAGWLAHIKDTRGAREKSSRREREDARSSEDSDTGLV